MVDLNKIINSYTKIQSMELSRVPSDKLLNNNPAWQRLLNHNYFYSAPIVLQSEHTVEPTAGPSLPSAERSFTMTPFGICVRHRPKDSARLVGVAGGI
ncbi:hypothetical protein DPEC_G00089800 [Dallia pectoralis]|uniref:Uncharacterized protein n=1 Tax=Dallia pectoralis TaxID=75939 RepID=A0ACC2H0R1_DALPE|nr:hypothetical protein DPEC_G00089800 [Dallia pectoralis]